MKKYFMIMVVVGVFSVMADMVWAHSGRTNSQGCHRDTKAGTYHCH